MTTATIPVDLFNPGQVFACLGFMEAADQLLGGARAGFDWSDPADTRFALATDADLDPFEAVLSFLEGATVQSLAPHGSEHRTEKWDVATLVLGPDAPFPSSAPDSPASLPAVLFKDGVGLVIDHWGDTTRRDNVKFWGGSGGYPGAGLARDALALAGSDLRAAARDPFSLSAVQTSSFRFDWRRDYIPLDAGFSLNAHADIAPRGYPLVELLAALGLSHARPQRHQKLDYTYAVIGRADGRDPEGARLVDPIFLRAALGGAALPYPTRTFRMNLFWPGQEGQARSITSTSEETCR